MSTFVASYRSNSVLCDVVMSLPATLILRACAHGGGASEDLSRRAGLPAAVGAALIVLLSDAGVLLNESGDEASFVLDTSVLSDVVRGAI